MDTRTGEIHDAEVMQRFLAGLIAQPERKCFVPVVRDVTAREKADKQILLYQPCGCGSGQKFKFCCHAK